LQGVDPAIDQLQRACAADPGIIGLAGGLPSPELFPREELAQSASRALLREGELALQYAWPEGRESLRVWIAARLARRGLSVTAADIIVTNGAQEALSIAASMQLRAGDPVCVDSLTYPGALDVFRACGARFVRHGTRARCAYVMPALSNPEGLVADDATRRRWIEWAIANDALILEDDAYGELCFDAEAPSSLSSRARERVFQIGTFSKTLAPGLRIGWLVAPPHLHADALERKRIRDLQGNSLTQALLDDFLARDDFDARLARSRDFYAERADALVAAVKWHLPEARFRRPRGGFSLWVTLPERGDDRELLACAAREGVSFDPGSMFRTSDDANGPIGLRLCFSIEKVARFDEGCRRLARAWRAWRSSRLTPVETRTGSHG
jgi:DNA-binding transcriptional MocR family regulator